MARKGVTYDQVANVASEIKARGQEPTLSAIRVELGDSGSFTTISTHLAKWRQEESERVDMRVLPPEVEQEMLKAVTTVWNVANKAASADIAAIKQDHADELKKLKQAEKEAYEEVATLEKALEKAEAEAASARQQANTAEKKLAATAGELEGIKKLYAQLLETMKANGQTTPPVVSGKKAERTKQEHQQEKGDAPENKPA